ncbi:MAG: hypothetical protein ACYC1C_14645 [Chloroflexota bacterium]
MAEKGKQERKGEGKMTVSEAGQKGGEKVSEKYPHEHFEEIGHKGGEKVSEKYPHEHFEEIGHKGGQKVRDLIDKGKEAEKK